MTKRQRRDKRNRYNYLREKLRYLQYAPEIKQLSDMDFLDKPLLDRFYSMVREYDKSINPTYIKGGILFDLEWYVFGSKGLNYMDLLNDDKVYKINSDINELTFFVDLWSRELDSNQQSCF